MRKILATIIAVMMTTMTMRATDLGYSNPIIPGFHPDPSVCCVGEDYYLVTSSFGYFPGVPVFHSRDLIHWQQIGNVLDRESQLWLGIANISLGIYAPTIRYNDGVYYMITTNVSKSAMGAQFGMDTRGNFYCTATNPAGPWSDPIWLDQGGIDPSLYFEDGKCYFCSNPNDQITLCEIDPKTGKQLTPGVVISQGTGGRYPEGSHIYKKDGWYYLLLAEGGTEEAHKLTLSRSRSIYGPYEQNPNNPILTHCCLAHQNNPIHGTGHGDLVQAHDGSWWLVGLAYRPQGMLGGTHHLLGRETFLSPVEWQEGEWPVVNGDGSFQLENPNTPTLPQVEMPKRAAHTDLSSPLGYEWLYIGNPVMTNYQTTPAGLKLQATDQQLSGGSLAKPTFVGVRQEHINCTVSTSLQLNNATAGDVAGLTAYMTAMGHYDVIVRERTDGQQEIALRYVVNSLRSDVKVVPIPNKGGNVELRCQATDSYYIFSCRTADSDWTELGRLEAKLLSTETQGGFTGMLFGLFAEGDKEAAGQATFHWFDYQY